MVDALTAGPLATFLKAPILLTETGNVLNADTEAELTKLKVKTVYITSGTGVISQAVLDRLTGLDIKLVSFQVLLVISETLLMTRTSPYLKHLTAF